MSKPFLVPDATNDVERASETNPWIRQSHDPSYIPGYSEQVQANDLATGDDLEFRQRHRHLGNDPKAHFYRLIGAEPKPLAVEFAWLRVNDPGGNRSYNADVDLMEYTSDGYIPATVETLTKYGYGFPPAGHKAPDGTIRRLDTMLYFIDGSKARVLKAERSAEARAADEPKAEHGADSNVPILVTDNERDKLELTTKE